MPEPKEPVEEAKKAGPKTYYLKPNREHSFIKDGELITLTETNDEAELSDAQFEAFGDKFNEEPISVPKPKAEETKEAPKAEDAKGKTAETK